MIAVAIFLVAALTTSQSAATRTMVPLGLALGIGAGYMIAMWTAVVGVLFLPANGTQIAAAEADRTGTTTLGKRVIDHSFQLPLQVAWIVTALVGIAIVRSSTERARGSRSSWWTPGRPRSGVPAGGLVSRRSSSTRTPLPSRSCCRR